MFTQELPAWRKKQRRQTASFQGKYRVEKSGGNLAHIRSHTFPPTAHTANQPPASPTHFQWNSNAYRALETKGAATSNTQWSTVGRTVGNAREGRGEDGGEPRGGGWSPGRWVENARGGGWGGRWGTPGRRVESARGAGRGEPQSLPRISVELRQTIIQIASGRSETLTNRINHILGSSTPSSHARSCGCGDMGGRMCVMVAQHS